MQIDLYDKAKMVSVNNLKEVSDPVLLIRGATPSPNGLLSTEIFGVTVRERKERFAYIDLGGWFFDPFVYKLLKRLNRKFVDVVHGTKNFSVVDGVVIEDDNGGTGIKFLYDNWEKINFEKNDSRMRNERIDLLRSYKKNVIFTKYWIVIPAFYRDVNFQNLDKGKISHHEINDLYAKLIRLCSVIKQQNNFDFILVSTEAKIQDTLVDIYDHLKSRIEKKQGMIRHNLLGKSIDYGSRMVISAPRFTADSPKDMKIDFYHTGVPLAQCCSLFSPFISNYVRNFFKREFERTGNKFPKKNKDGSTSFVKLKDSEIYFNDEYIKKQIDRFIFAYGDRFSPIELHIEGSEETAPLMFTGRIYDKNSPESGSTIERPMTWCDILYQAAIDVTENKMVQITRYPLTQAA